ncbi:dethiobiotin synthase [Pseudomonas sp. F1_0610]|uniref:dethiobiotin synthase n=1 Tax=Pseudomonas sp. F1_0610 TaxID=3114284 RepID=UPI0039C3A196
MQAYFIAGTDTDVGKTSIAAGLLCRAQQLGYATLAIKPVASGCQQTADGLRNSDALALMAESSLKLNYEHINPFAFAPAIAPHIAAQESNTELSVHALQPAIDHVLAQQADFVVVEGAGGWRVPLSATEFLSDLAKAIKLPVILVVGVRLGCISHALLTAEAIKADGLKLAGWVANIIDPNTSRLPENLATLTQLMPAPCLGVVPFLTPANADSVAQHVDLSVLK